MKSARQHITEARESLERRWREIASAMSGIPPTSNPMGPFNQYELDVNLGGDFPVKIKPFSLSAVAGPLADFEYNTARRGGTIRLDPGSSVQRSPTLWHELAHGTQARSFDTAMFDDASRQLKLGSSEKTAKAIRASQQAPVPYHAKTREMDARAVEQGQVSANAGRRAAETMLQDLRALAQEQGALPPSTEPLERLAAYRKRMTDASVKAEKNRIQAALAQPVDTPMPTVFGGTRAPNKDEIKIRAAAARKTDQAVRRGMQNMADMTSLGFDQTASPAIIKGIIRHVKSRTGVSQYSPKEWSGLNKLLDAISRSSVTPSATRAASTGVASRELPPPRPLVRGELPPPPPVKPTDINTRSFSVSPRKPGGLRGLGLAGIGGVLAAGADAGASVAGVYSTPEPRTRMEGEKTYGTDVGLGFDVDAQGELMADPAGMEAARRRGKQGRSFRTWYPER